MSEATLSWPRRVAGPRSFAFDVSQHDFDFSGFPDSSFTDDYYSNPSVSFVSTVQQCAELLATRTISNHDYKAYNARGRLSAFVYGNLISPFSPHWFMGEEFDHRLNFCPPPCKPNNFKNPNNPNYQIILISLI
jgi:hypothetical protein